jgi:TPP-dependent pyruvate/acetoin dehydrogenase alpha subunit
MTATGEDVRTRTSEAAIDVDPQTRLALFEQMLRMRYLEKRAYDLFMQNLVKGTSHLSLGQEAIAAGFGVAMRQDDYTFATYRGHAHTLARGVPMEGILAELMGRANGLMAGKGGSMHLTSVEHGMMGSYAIIGAHLTIANGAAWSAQFRGSGQVAVCFFGDGTTNIGAFHEALNFAVIWNLPVVFVCENNFYMEYTAIETVTAVPRPAADRAGSYLGSTGRRPRSTSGWRRTRFRRTAADYSSAAFPATTSTRSRPKSMPRSRRRRKRPRPEHRRRWI